MSPPDRIAGGNGGSSHKPVEGHPGLISVKTEIAAEFLINGFFDAVGERYPGEVPQVVVGEFERTLTHVLGEERAREASPPARDLAAKLARAGYVSRVIEHERFPPANEPTLGLTDKLRARWAAAEGDGDWLEAVVETSAEFARNEPFGKPAPNDKESMAWRVRGPGGHVRHIVAVRYLLDEVNAEPLNGELPEGVEEIGELKRCWMYGFYLRSCEEALPPEASLE